MVNTDAVTEKPAKRKETRLSVDKKHASKGTDRKLDNEEEKPDNVNIDLQVKKEDEEVEGDHSESLPERRPTERERTPILEALAAVDAKGRDADEKLKAGLAVHVDTVQEQEPVELQADTMKKEVDAVKTQPTKLEAEEDLVSDAIKPPEELEKPVKSKEKNLDTPEKTPKRVKAKDIEADGVTKGTRGKPKDTKQAEVNALEVKPVVNQCAVLEEDLIETQQPLHMAVKEVTDFKQDPRQQERKERALLNLADVIESVISSSNMVESASPAPLTSSCCDPVGTLNMEDQVKKTSVDFSQQQDQLQFKEHYTISDEIERVVEESMKDSLMKESLHSPVTNAKEEKKIPDSPKEDTKGKDIKRTTKSARKMETKGRIFRRKRSVSHSEIPNCEQKQKSPVMSPYDFPDSTSDLSENSENSEALQKKPKVKTKAVAKERKSKRKEEKGDNTTVKVIQRRKGRIEKTATLHEIDGTEQEERTVIREPKLDVVKQAADTLVEENHNAANEFLVVVC